MKTPTQKSETLNSLEHELTPQQWIMDYPDYLEEATTYFNHRPFFKGLSGTGVEIGTFEGYNATGIVKFTQTSKLYCVDPYKAYVCPVGEYMVGFSQENWDEIFERAKKKLEGYPVEFIRTTSLDAAKLVPDNLDWVYIDGLHTSDSVYNDLCGWCNKVAIGGRIGGHDASEVEIKVGLSRWVDTYKIDKNCVQFMSNEWWITRE